MEAIDGGFQITKSKAGWEQVVDNIRSGRARFSTGYQERTAQYLADFIENAVYYCESDAIPLDLDWDAALSVAQAS